MNAQKNWKAFFNAGQMRKETVEGDVVRYIYTGEHLQVVEYHFPPNKSFPAHSHDAHEQMGYVVSGKACFTVNGQKKDLSPGDWYHAPVGVKHEVSIYDEPTVLLDFFSPPRDDLKG
ncbi:cupin domain-containing protein [Marispirochaeta sp.]|jgi:quercetin dioxygenase-like cupin family protein|uniref:cupin domain-containing protein n=1 Tax=Marispirochaeta sp. TaxID=2038653 RepID=UPI0029C648CE|nr:cupin domain-containing protein [Marispirochaeta sp.]